MTFVCLWSPDWATAGAPLAELATALLEQVPRVAVEGRGVIWADARGLPAPKLAWSLLKAASPPSRVPENESQAQGGATGLFRNPQSAIHNQGVKAGVAAVPIAAELAARSGVSPVTLVEAGYERAFLAPLPIKLLEPEPRLLSLLDGVGLRTCGELAGLEREAVEARFGGGGASLWRLARADDPRRIFGPIPRERAHASLDFVDYEVSDSARLLFTANALLGSVCETLRSRGERAREMTLTLTLSMGGMSSQPLRCARPTADRAVWFRRLRSALDRWALSGSVSGVSLRAEGTEPVSATQGDIFDRGFATAAPVEEAVARLSDEHGSLFVEPQLCAYPLAERRAEWLPLNPERVAEAAPRPGLAYRPCFTLQLLPEPRRIAVKTVLRRNRFLPTSYYDGKRWYAFAAAAGPDRVSGGRWEGASYAREYFRCVTEAGMLVWLYRDAIESCWYLHGWWD
jgi:protein ImuB